MPLPSSLDRPATTHGVDQGGERPTADDDTTLATRNGLERFFFEQAGQPEAQVTGADANPLLAFTSETNPLSTNRASAPAPQAQGVTKRNSAWPIAVACGTAVAIGFSALAMNRQRSFQPQAAAARPGNLTVNSRPPGAEVFVDGQKRGVTPLTLSLNSGAYSVTIRLDGRERVVPVTLAAESEVVQYFEMPAADPPLAAGGRISVVTSPPGARVAVDGRPHGVSPVTVGGLTAAEHRVTVTSDTESTDRLVTVARGGTTSVVFSLPQLSLAVGGWLSVAAPFEVQVLEREDVVGASGASGITKIMLPAGRHNLQLVNPTLDYAESRMIDILPGKVANLSIDAPNATISVNARPWADVLIDAKSVGQTPIANLVIPIGTHEVIFRHPDLGQRRQSVVVTTKGPNRIAVDLTK